MQLKTPPVAPALKALLESLFDYAGVYPPAKLPVETAIDNYSQYYKNSYSWMLKRFVIGAADLGRVPESWDGSIALLSDKDDCRAGAIETTTIIAASHPVYVEVPTDKLQLLDEVKKSGCLAKVRTGSIKPEGIPSTAEVATFIIACAERRLPFKATAGLHHPIRAVYPLTYEPDAPRAYMHGFLNVLLASALAWQGDRDIEPILAETDADAFVFNDEASWRKERSLTAEQISDARRNFMHSIGSCSFEEPLQDLRSLGFIE